jgi:hypothetical protein
MSRGAQHATRQFADQQARGAAASRATSPISARYANRRAYCYCLAQLRRRDSPVKTNRAFPGRIGGVALIGDAVLVQRLIAEVAYAATVTPT